MDPWGSIKRPFASLCLMAARLPERNVLNPPEAGNQDTVLSLDLKSHGKKTHGHRGQLQSCPNVRFQSDTALSGSGERMTLHLAAHGRFCHASQGLFNLFLLHTQEPGQDRRPKKTPLQAAGGLGHLNSFAVGIQDPRPRPFGSRYRQQAAWLRSGGPTRQRCGPLGNSVAPRDRPATQDPASRPVRDSLSTGYSTILYRDLRFIGLVSTVFLR